MSSRLLHREPSGRKTKAAIVYQGPDEKSGLPRPFKPWSGIVAAASAGIRIYSESFETIT